MIITPATKILICGLPGSGKTTLAFALNSVLLPNVVNLDGDKVRKVFNDWRFGEEARERQAVRMRQISELMIAQSLSVIASFVAPTEKCRKLYAPGYTIWMDTVESCQYNDTNEIFENPAKYNLRVTNWDTIATVEQICSDLAAPSKEHVKIIVPTKTMGVKAK